MTTDTEQTATPGLEAVLKGQASPEPAEVSEEKPTTENTEGEEPKEPEVKEEKEAITFTPEQEAEIERRYQSRKDKEHNPYREKREADTALIRSQATQIKELKGTQGTAKLTKAMEAVLAGDEEEGLEPDKIEARKKGFEEIKASIKKYNENAAEIEEAVNLFSSVTEKIKAQKAIGGFGLNDPNPVVRVKNYAEFINETISVFGYNQDFLMVMEHFLPKGDELRPQIEAIVDGMAEEHLENDNSKIRFIKENLQGVKITHRKKPPTPSDITGGADLSKLSSEDRLVRGLDKMDKGK